MLLHKKSVKEVCAWRLYGGAILIGAYSSLGRFLLAMIRNEEVLLVWFVLGIVLMGQLCSLGFNVMVFSWKYSALGGLRRYLPSSKGARLVAQRTQGLIGSLRTPFITWLVADDGLIIRIGGLGNGFVPREYVRRLEPNVGWGCRLEHDWPEIKSPIIMPCEVANEFAKICAPQSVMI